ncbi:hypothetical protein GCM10011371_12580 [Novosphingobium marinum]|nr:hypothetical protein GCM10011371_12580 [Novosphingobium marinum]
MGRPLLFEAERSITRAAAGRKGRARSGPDTGPEAGKEGYGGGFPVEAPAPPAPTGSARTSPKSAPDPWPGPGDAGRGAFAVGNRVPKVVTTAEGEEGKRLRAAVL